MARTSAARDLNHIRSTRLTIQQAERFMLHNVSEARISATIADIEYNGVGRDELLLERMAGTKVRQLTHRVSPFYVQSATVDGFHLPIKTYSGLFRLAKASRSLDLSRDKILLMHFDRRMPIDYVVQYALDNGFEGLIYIVPPHWSPKFGVREYPIPIAVCATAPSRWTSVTFEFGASDNRAIEKTVQGHISETVLVGSSEESPESLAVFVEMMLVLDALATRGWRPYRTIHFVSFPRFSAAIWALDQQRWISQHAVAFIDTTKTSSISASPLLNRTMNWAVDTLKNGGLYFEEPNFSGVINPPDGANAFELDFQLPSVSAGLSDPVSTTRMLNLVLASIAIETVVPFVISDYSVYLDSDAFDDAAASFDALVELLKFEFTHEYPWYQGMQKLRSIVQLKRANARLVGFERQLRGKSGSHVVFANDRSGAGTTISPVPSEVSEAVNSLLQNSFLSI